MGGIDAPLGSRRARPARRLPERQAQALRDLDAWFEQHPQAWVSISGGKDSMVCLHLARQVNPDVKAVWFDQQLEFPQTRAFLARIQQKWGFELITIPPSDPTPLQVLVKSGFWEHGAPKRDFTGPDPLEEACIIKPARVARERLGKWGVYGLRADESRARRALLGSRRNGVVLKHGRDGQVEYGHLAPIWRWSYEEVYAYHVQHKVPLNPLYRLQVALGVPERRARVGFFIDGAGLDTGRWAICHALAPDQARLVETYLPALADYR